MRSFIGIPEQSYIGNPVRQKSNLVRNSPIPQFYIPLRFNWLVYQAAAVALGGTFANANVRCNLSGQQPAQQIDQISSMYIDNTGGDAPIYVQFADNGFTIVMQPNSAGWRTVLSNSQLFNVVALGLKAGDVSATTIYCSNIFVPPETDSEIPQTLDLWKASPLITGGQNIYNTNYGTPALGDQTISKNIDINAVGVIVPVFPAAPVGSPDFIYITNVFAGASNLSAGSGGIREIVFENALQTVQKLNIDFYIGSAPANQVPLYPCLELHGCNIQLDGAQAWQLRVTVGATNGNVAVTFVYTRTPV